MSSDPQERRGPGLWFAILVALSAFVVLLVVFAPRFLYWQGMDLPSSTHNPPEINRAIDTLRQLEDPWLRIENPTNRVINWRLLFPILGHYLHLPAWAFLALPYLGCVLVLAEVARVMGREATPRWVVLLATILTGSASWFFVSTGWLAYFDSWCILALLVVSFSRFRLALAVACLLAPWIDERFILALPMALAVRFGYFEEPREGETRRPILGDVALCFGLVAPYCLLRVFMLLASQDVGSAAHLRSHSPFRLDPWQVLDGLWAGLRALWVPVFALVVLLLVRKQWSRATLLALTIPATAVVGAIIANDLSRSVSTLIPAALLGLILVLRRWPAPAPLIIIGLLVFNLLMPARHVIAGWERSLPISNLYLEARMYRDPPPAFARLFLSWGQLFLKSGRLREALREFDRAIATDPGLAAAHYQRGVCLSRLGRSDEAQESYAKALDLSAP